MRIDRLIAIVMVLLNKGKMSSTELSEMFEVTPRTIYRDIDTINQAGVPIVSTTGINGGFAIMESYKIEKQLFSTSDFVALLMGLGNVESTLPDETIRTALIKVKNMLSDQQITELEKQSQQIKIDHTSWGHITGDAYYMTTIKQALSKSHLLSFEYRDKNNVTTHRTIEPYRLLLKAQDWYLQGYCRERKAYRTFKLLRIYDLKPLEELFLPREDYLEYLDQMEFMEDNLIPAKLRIHQDIVNQFIDEFGGENVTPEQEGYYIVHCQTQMVPWQCRYLLGFGSLCECLEPPEMRKMLKNELTAMLSQYE